MMFHRSLEVRDLPLELGEDHEGRLALGWPWSAEVNISLLVLQGRAAMNPP